MPHAPAEVLAAYGEAFVADPEHAGTEYYSEDVVLVLAGSHRFAGRHEGRSEVIAALHALSEATGGTLNPVLLGPPAFGPEHAVVHLDMAAEVAHRSVRWRRMVEYQVRDGRIQQITCYEADDALLVQIFGTAEQQ